MTKQKLKTVNDARLAFDDKKPEVVRSFFGEELVETQEISAVKAQFSAEEPDLETTQFLEANANRFQLDNITLKPPTVMKGKAITSIQYQQSHNGYPVYDATLTISLRQSDGKIFSAVNNIDYFIPADMPGESRIIQERDVAGLVSQYFDGLVHDHRVKVTGLFVYRHRKREHILPPRECSRSLQRVLNLATGEEGKLYLVWQVMADTDGPSGNWELLLDATTGQIISVFNRQRYFAQRAYVFMPDPITTSCEDKLTWETPDHILDAQRVVVDLEHLEAATDGKWLLMGKWVKCIDVEPATFPTPTSDTDGHFMFGSKKYEFLFAMGYYWTTKLITYLQTLGIKVLNERVTTPLVIDVLGLERTDIKGDRRKTDNSKTKVNVDNTPYIVFGEGGVPDASDAHVIVHEYGHVIHHLLEKDQGCYEEGFCDFLAVAWLDRFNKKRFQREIVFPWDDNKAINWGPERRLNVTEKFSDADFKNQGAYSKGSIWATALWQLFLGIGGNDGPKESAKAADTVIQMYLEMLLMVKPHLDPEKLALGLIEADKQIHGFPGKYRKEIWEAFKERGLWEGDPPPLTS